jgi:hypothetical protein
MDSIKVTLLGVNKLSGMVRGALNDVRAAAPGFKGALSPITSMLSGRGMLFGGMAAGYATGRFLKGSVEEFQKAEDASANLRASIRLMEGDLNKEMGRYESFAENLGATTTFDDESIKSIMAIGRAAGFSGKALEEMTLASIGLSARGNKPLEESMKGIIGVLSGSDRVFKSNKIALDATMQKHEKFNRIVTVGIESLRYEQEKIGTYSGKIKMAGNAWSDFKEKVGESAAVTKPLEVGTDILRGRKSVEQGALGLAFDFENWLLKKVSFGKLDAEGLKKTKLGKFYFGSEKEIDLQEPAALTVGAQETRMKEAARIIKEQGIVGKGEGLQYMSLEEYAKKSAAAAAHVVVDNVSEFADALDGEGETEGNDVP